MTLNAQFFFLGGGEVYLEPKLVFMGRCRIPVGFQRHGFVRFRIGSAQLDGDDNGISSLIFELVR